MPNVYVELTTALTQVKDILAAGADLIRPAVHTLGSMIPQITEMLTLVLNVIGQIRTAISNLDASMLPIDQVLPFVNAAKSLLEAGQKMLPDSAEEIGSALEVVEVVASCPTPEQLKADTLDLLDAVSLQIASLQQPA